MPWDRASDLSRSVVLVHPTASGCGGRLVDLGFLIPPLGPMYLSAQLRRAGVDTVLIDEAVDGAVLPDLLTLPRERAPRLIGIYVNQSSESRVVDLLAACRGSRAGRVVTGGPASLGPERLLEAGADAVCIGEGDQAILDLAAWAAGERDLTSIPGLALPGNGRPHHTPPRPLLQDLDSLPFPDRDSYPPDRVPYDNLYPGVRLPFATLMSSRGCPMRCSYCASPVLWGHAVRRRSVESTLEEVDLLVRRFGIRFLDIYDDVFNLKPEWTVRFCEGLIRRGVKLSWAAYFYPVGFDAEILRLARRAGLTVFKIGAQSGSPEILQSIERRSATLEQVRLYLDECRRLGIFSAVDFIFGLPGETPETLEQSVRYIRTLEADSVKIAKFVRLPGSPLERRGGEQPAHVSEAELDSAIRRALFGYYLRPRRLLRTAYWGALRGTSWRNLSRLVRLARLALEGLAAVSRSPGNATGSRRSAP